MPERILLDAGPSSKGWSRIETATHCMQLYAYKHILDVDLPTADPLIRGSLGHIGLAHWYRRLQAFRAGEDPAQWFTPTEAMHILANRHGGRWIELLPEMQRASLAYVQHYGGLHERIEILAVEQQVEAVVHGYRYTQRMDLIAKFPDGKTKIVDHKFVSRTDGASTSAYALSGQFLGIQQFGRAIYGADFGGALINAINIGGAAAESYTFKRSPPELAPWAVECHPDSVRDAEEEIARLGAAGRDPWRYPKRLSVPVCWTKFGPCPARDLCKWGPPVAGGVPRETGPSEEAT